MTLHTILTFKDGFSGETGKLSSVSIHYVPESLFTNRSRLAAKRRLTIPVMQREEVERKFAYVKGVLDSNISGFTEKNLAPFIKIKSSEINDLSPPSWRSLVCLAHDRFFADCN